MRPSYNIALNNLSAATTQTSVNIPAESVVYASVQAVLTGSPVGTLKIQVSNDETNPQTWSDLTSVSVSISAAGTYLIPATLIAHSFIRVVYAATSGTGTVTATLKTSGY